MKTYASFFEWHDKGRKELGVVEELIEALSKCSSIHLHSPREFSPDPPDCVCLYIWSARDQMARISRRLPVALRIGDWDSVLTMLNQANLPTNEKTAHLRFLAAEISEYATGMKALEANDIAAAQNASARMDAELMRAKQEQAAESKDITETLTIIKRDIDGSITTK